MLGPAPKANKKYLQVACTSLLTYYFLGERSLPSFKGFIYSDLYGTVVVHDRYVNYDHFAGISHQLCTPTCCETSRTLRRPTGAPPPPTSPLNCARVSTPPT